MERKYTVSMTVSTSVRLYGVKAIDPDDLWNGDYDAREVERALIDQILKGEAILDAVIDEVEAEEEY